MASSKLPYCLVNRLYAYGTGGPVSLRYDRDILLHLLGRFAGHGYRLPDLLREIALSQAFSQVRLVEKPQDDAVVAMRGRPSQSEVNGQEKELEEEIVR